MPERIDVPCTIHNSLLFERAKLLAQHMEKIEGTKRAWN